MNLLEIVKALIPTVIHVIKPELDPLASTILHGVDEAEQIPGAKGSDKLTHVQNIATAVGTGINQATGKDKINIDTLNEATQEAIDTSFAVAKLIHAKADKSS